MSKPEGRVDHRLLSEETAALDDAVNLVIGTFKCPPAKPACLPNEKQFGELFTFTEQEIQQLETLRELVKNYVLQPSPPRPLCLSVFGPPGSGKSFAVEQICAEVTNLVKTVKLPLIVVNMTQVASAGEVGRVLARVAGEQDQSTVPIVFVDEFDASRGSTPYGWLAWFLAPMHDGVFLHEGATIRLKRAVYVFAGGTASTMDEFASRQEMSEFKFAKGPDFVSRLRGFLDVLGPNAAPRESRRALLLRKEFAARISRNSQHRSTPCKPCEVDDRLIRALLRVGRYRHGARSISAVVELSGLEASQEKFGFGNLPPEHLLRLHVDRGPLDSKRIGGAVALSGYTGEDTAVVDCFLHVARFLWSEGATLAFAGRWGDDYSLVEVLADELRLRSMEPNPDDRKREKPEPWLKNYLYSSEGALANLNEAITEAERHRIGLEVVVQSYLTQAEQEEFKDDSVVAKIIERFRRRLAVSESSVARFAIAGATAQHEGRMPGIVEEVMITIALGGPVYISGGFGGAAADVGSLLGLAHPRTGEIPRSLRQDNVPDATLDSIAENLRPAPLTMLPVKPAEVVTFLKGHALGGPGWPKNGLDADENRALFESRKGTEIAGLVLTGLKRVFSKRE
jgi:hypothetical protein